MSKVMFETIPLPADEFETEFESDEIASEYADSEWAGEDEEENERGGRLRSHGGRERRLVPQFRPIRARRPIIAAPRGVPSWLVPMDEPVPDSEPFALPDDGGSMGFADDPPAGPVGDEPAEEFGIGRCKPSCRCAACQNKDTGERESWSSEEEFGEAEFETLELEPTQREGGWPKPSRPPGVATCAIKPAPCPPSGPAAVTLEGFAFDRSELVRPRHSDQLTGLARRIVAAQASRNPIGSLLIAGHADQAGPDAYNVGLAQRRAETVARELCQTLERMRTGSGRSLSIGLATCGETQARSNPKQSRRVEIFLPPTPIRPRRCPPNMRERVTLHLKVLVPPTRFSIATMLASMRQVFAVAGIHVVVGSQERLKLPALEDLDVFCPREPCRTRTTPLANFNPEHVALFQHRRNVGRNEMTVYFVRSTIPGLNGTSAHPPGRPGVIISATASRWSLAHEVGHVLGLCHVNNNDRLMTGGGTNNITNPPPDLIASETATMLGSSLTIPC